MIAGNTPPGPTGQQDFLVVQKTPAHRNAAIIETRRVRDPFRQGHRRRLQAGSDMIDEGVLFGAPRHLPGAERDQHRQRSRHHHRA
jgi:hypothetical protein